MRRAFTLIELLVVIAIIAILAAILFPVFAQAKLAAKQTASLSSVKQLMTSEAIYNGDFDDQDVPWIWYDRGSGVTASYMEFLDPYVKNVEIYKNSAASTAGSTFGVAASGTCPTPTVVSHYVRPMFIRYSYWDWFGTTMFAGFPVSANPLSNPPAPVGAGCGALAAHEACQGSTQVAEPASTVVMAPGYYVTSPRPDLNLKFGAPCSIGFAPEHGKPDPVDTKVHTFREGGNYGMADGHAKWYSSKGMNGNASRVKVYGGSNYPSSPHMVIVD
jgi:prepilin-type N-terminal cleavage/methylation domain-containing protein/prepilin-type processing-associated H-X9-DG protein